MSNKFSIQSFPSTSSQGRSNGRTGSCRRYSGHGSSRRVPSSYNAASYSSPWAYDAILFSPRSADLALIQAYT